MLAMKGSDGVIQASLVGLADRAKVSVEECRKALKVLSPDEHDTSGAGWASDSEVPGGWQIVNNDLYQFSTEAKREFGGAEGGATGSGAQPRGSARRSHPAAGEC